MMNHEKKNRSQSPKKKKLQRKKRRSKSKQGKPSPKVKSLNSVSDEASLDKEASLDEAVSSPVTPRPSFNSVSSPKVKLLNSVSDEASLDEAVSSPVTPRPSFNSVSLEANSVKAKPKKNKYSMGLVPLGNYYSSSGKKCVSSGDSVSCSVLESSTHLGDDVIVISESENEHEISPRNYLSALLGAASVSTTEISTTEISKSEQPREILKSLIRTPESSAWMSVAKKSKPRGKTATPVNAKGVEYQVCREPARKHWDMMKSCYEEGSTSYTKGERGYAGYMFEKGRTEYKKAREAEEKASQDIFRSRNAGICNEIKFDLHGQHPREALEIVKQHLKFGANLRTVRSLRVITGLGKHSKGNPQIKESVINLLRKERIAYDVEKENSGVLVIYLDGQTDFDFLDTDGD